MKHTPFNLMEEELETIEIFNADGEMVRINKTDFDEKTMKPFKEQEAPKPTRQRK